MAMDIVMANLGAAFAKPGCPICRLRQEAELTYIRRLLYDYVNDGLTRLGFARSQGWCPRHAWFLQASEQADWGDGLKTATIYESIAARVHKNLAAYLERQPALREPSPGSPHKRATAGWRTWLARRRDAVARWMGREPTRSPTTRLVSLLASRRECPVCENLADQEAAAAAKLAAGISDPGLRALWRASDGLCLPHLRNVLACAPDEETARFIVELADEQLAVLLTHLRAYMDKHRWEDRSLLSPEERAAWIRVVAFFAGEAQEDRAPDALRAMRQAAMEEYAPSVHSGSALLPAVDDAP